MSWSAAAIPPRKGELPAALEGRARFCVKTAGLSRPAAPVMSPAPDVVLMTGADGGVVVYRRSLKLAILAEERAKRAPAKLDR